MYLPVEIVDIILEYSGHIRIRLGKRMKQLDLNHTKYDFVKENIERKQLIVNEVKKETYFVMDRNSKLKWMLDNMYPVISFAKYTKRIIYKTIHSLIPPYRNQYYYMWENYSLSTSESSF